MKVYCPYCKNEVEYKIEKRELTAILGFGKMTDMKEEVFQQNLKVIISNY